MLEYDDCYIELIENYPCNDRNELHKRAGELIRGDENAINKMILGRTRKQYKQDNKERAKETDKKYREKNKDKINEKAKQYREANREKYQCECGSNITKCSKTRHERTKKHQAYINTVLT